MFDLEPGRSAPMASLGREILKKRNENLRVILASACGLLLGVFLGIFLSMLEFSSTFPDTISNYHEIVDPNPLLKALRNRSQGTKGLPSEIIVAEIVDPNPLLKALRNRPQGTEGLPPGIIVAETDLYQRRLWGDPAEDLPKEPSKYLVTFSVGINQKESINATVAKFPKEWTFMLFHYDGNTDAWDEFEWSKTAIHVSVKKQAKWWYAKRFLHPDVVAPYDYIFLWDEDLGVENFDAAKYIEIVRKQGLEISQPALELGIGESWEMTKRRAEGEVHKTAVELPGWCTDPQLPPCGGFVEIMAPVFSRKAWRCVWHMIQNDLVHGWGLDFSMRRCVDVAHEKIGVVDSQWIQHQGIPSLGQNGAATRRKNPREMVRDRCGFEWKLFAERLEAADEAVEESGEKILD